MYLESLLIIYFILVFRTFNIYDLFISYTCWAELFSNSVFLQPSFQKVTGGNSTTMEIAHIQISWFLASTEPQVLADNVCTKILS